MSRDISLHRFDRVAVTSESIPDDAVVLPLGTRAEVQQAIAAVFTGTDWSDPEWGRWSGDEGSVEFNLGGDDPPLTCMLHLHALPAVTERIRELCRRQQWQALDCSTETFLAPG